MIIPQPRKDKSAKNIKRIREQIKLILLQRASELRVNTYSFDALIVVFSILEPMIKNKMYRYYKIQEVLESRYKDKQIGYIRFKISLFMNWLKFKINEFICKP